jgi:hypothetical protein
METLTSSIPAKSYQTLVTVGEIVDMTDQPIQTSNGSAHKTTIITDTGDVVALWQDESAQPSPHMVGKKVGDEVGLILDIKTEPKLDGTVERKVYAKPIKLERAQASISNAS